MAFTAAELEAGVEVDRMTLKEMSGAGKAPAKFRGNVPAGFGGRLGFSLFCRAACLGYLSARQLNSLHVEF